MPRWVPPKRVGHTGALLVKRVPTRRGIYEELLHHTVGAAQFLSTSTVPGRNQETQKG